MRTSNRLTALADALRPLAAAADLIQRDLPEGTTEAKVEAVALALSVAVGTLEGEAAILRRSGD